MATLALSEDRAMDASVIFSPRSLISEKTHVILFWSLFHA